MLGANQPKKNKTDSKISNSARHGKKLAEDGGFVAVSSQLNCPYLRILSYQGRTTKLPYEGCYIII